MTNELLFKNNSSFISYILENTCLIMYSLFLRIRHEHRILNMKQQCVLTIVRWINAIEYLLFARPYAMFGIY